MEKSENSKDKKAQEIAPKELKHVEKLIQGHKKILTAIGNL